LDFKEEKGRKGNCRRKWNPGGRFRTSMQTLIIRDTKRWNSRRIKVNRRKKRNSWNTGGRLRNSMQTLIIRDIKWWISRRRKGNRRKKWNSGRRIPASNRQESS